ncbi:hypothetical protein [Sporosarcina obsidiansis]|nr:hypothetical protein [Sporosarcina obsidiansis]
MTIVEAREVQKSYGAHHVLKGVEFQANEGGDCGGDRGSQLFWKCP